MSEAVPTEVRQALRRRGIMLRESDGGRDDLLVGTWPEARRDRFYAEMQRYSFRLVLRDLIRLGRRGVTPEELARQASLRAVRGHLRALTELGLVGPAAGGQVKLLARASSLGPTLEWFVAELLRRELGFCVGWSLPLRGGSTGGDLDVVGLAEGRLLLVEVKSGPPKHLDVSHVGAFLDRVQALVPHGAIFFEDTELRMKDKVVPMFEDALAARGVALRPRRLKREIFAVGSGLFIANAHPEALTNLSHCVGCMFREGGVDLGLDAG